MYIKTAPGRAVRDPDTLELVPASGREVRDNHHFWMTRLRDGDIEIVVAAPPPVDGDI